MIKSPVAEAEITHFLILEYDFKVNKVGWANQYFL